MTKKYILAIDQGTSSSRAVLFDEGMEIVQIVARDLKRYFPQDKYVEQDPQEILDGTFACIKEILEENSDKNIVSCGIVNQRETVILWDKVTGQAVYNAIVWQDQRTSDWCKNNEKEFDKLGFKEKTGLVLNPYFSASKIKWILDNVENTSDLLKENRLICGTVDCFLLWHLTKGKKHATDSSNASRTLLLDLKTGQWDQKLLDFFQIPQNILPEIKNSCDDFGKIAEELFGKSIPIKSLIGDQQGATIGQGCIDNSMSKITFGTGCFLMVNSGNDILYSKNGLLSTILYSFEDKIIYGLEGSCFYAGAVIQWLRDDLELINDVNEIEDLVKNAKNIDDLYLVPAFAGLGAPYWKADARAIIKGITPKTGKKEIVKAALDGVILQSLDLINSIKDDGIDLSKIKIDGGMVKNDWFNQRLSNILQKTIDVPVNIESTAAGAAIFAGIGADIFSFSDIKKLCPRKEQKLPEKISNYQKLVDGWKKVVLSC